MTHPWLLLALLLLPAYAWLRRRETRPSSRIVSSLLLWAEVPAAREAPKREWERRTDLILALELAGLGGIVLGLADPMGTADATVRPIVVYLDRSASLTTIDPSGRTRWERLRDALDRWVAAYPPGGRFRLLTGTGEDGGLLDRDATRAAIGSLRPGARGESPAEGVTASWSLARALGDVPPVIVTDRAPDAEETCFWLSRGGPSANAGIVACAAGRRGGVLEVVVSVRHAGAVERSVTVVLAGAEPAQVRLAPHAEEHALLELPWTEFLRAGPCLAIRLEPGDELPADDVVWLAPPPAPPTVWRGGPDNAALDRALEAVFGAVRRSDRPPPDAQGLFVFDRSTPEHLPLGPCLVIAAPHGVPGVLSVTGAPRSIEPEVRWAADPLLRHTHAERAWIGTGLPVRFAESERMRVLAESAGTPLLAVGESGGRPVFWIGFDVSWRGEAGDSDWAQLPGFPIFFANLARSWGFGTDCDRAPRTIRPGEPLTLPPGATVGPEGGGTARAPAPWRPTEAGCYRVRSSAGEYAVGVSLLSREETENGGADFERLPRAGGNETVPREGWRLPILAALAALGAVSWLERRGRK